MICGALAPDAACAVITLDTTPPVLHLSGTERLEPPDTGSYVLRANEPLGRIAAIFFDSNQHPYVLGVERVDDFTAVITLPASGMPQGYGRLLVVATDRACNEALAETKIYVSRPRLIDMLPLVGPVMRLTLSERPVMDLNTEVVPPALVEPRQDRVYEQITLSTSAMHLEARTDGD